MLSVVLLNVVMLSVIMLSVVMLSAVMLSAVMLSAVMLSVVMLSVVMLRVVAPLLYKLCFAEMEKCARYWPGPNSNGTQVFENFSVKTVAESRNQCYKTFYGRELRLFIIS
jgi:hypothetical protein